MPYGKALDRHGNLYTGKVRQGALPALYTGKVKALLMLYMGKVRELQEGPCPHCTWARWVGTAELRLKKSVLAIFFNLSSKSVGPHPCTTQVRPRTCRACWPSCVIPHNAFVNEGHATFFLQDSPDHLLGNLGYSQDLNLKHSNCKYYNFTLTSLGRSGST